LKISRRIPNSTFWRGEGDLYDSSHGGLRIRCSVPDRVAAELAEFDFDLVKVVGDDYPRASRMLFTDWYYYVFYKTDNGLIGRKPCA
jgi:hypothetical protein